MSERGLMIVLSAPSGTGKDTVLQELFDNGNVKRIKRSISVTTRPPRKGEVDGRDYFFVSKEKFLQMIQANEMLEYTVYCDNYYGTPRNIVNAWIDEGYDVILKIEVKGGAYVKKSCAEAIGIFVLPPSMQGLESRLKNRNTESIESFGKRMIAAKEEVKYAIEYDYVVINDEIGDCVDSICNIIRAEKLKSFRMNKIINEVLGNV